MSVDSGPGTSSLGGWRVWITSSERALRVERWLARGAGAGAVLASAIVLFTLLTGRPLPDVGLLLIPAIPLLFVGQVWVIGLIRVRTPIVEGGWWARIVAQRRAGRDPRRMFFPDLSKREANILIGLFFAGWLAAFAAFPSLTQGGPTTGRPGCPWALSEAGTITCVSHATYLRAGAAVERFPAGVLFCFFTMHFGAITSELRRRRIVESPPQNDGRVV